jgi:bla regulator protein BlaR1
VVHAPDVASTGAETAFAVWLAGAVLLGAWAFLRHLRMSRRLLQGSRPAEVPHGAARRMGLRRTPAVRLSPAVETPCVLGWFRPIVLLPAGGADERALLHEFAHIRRRDPLMGLASLAMQILYWFHPAAWIIRSRLATLREVGCDADVARALGDDAPEYRKLLLDYARRAIGRPAAGLSGLAFGRSRLVERIEWLSRRPGSRLSCAASALVAALVLAACVPPRRAPEPPFAWPTLSETRGCLQRRFVVMEALSRNP